MSQGDKSQGTLGGGGGGKERQSKDSKCFLGRLKNKMPKNGNQNILAAFFRKASKKYQFSLNYYLRST